MSLRLQVWGRTGLSTKAAAYLQNGCMGDGGGRYTMVVGVLVCVVMVAHARNGPAQQRDVLPSAGRVIRDMRGASERDSAARAYAAFQWLAMVAESRGDRKRAEEYGRAGLEVMESEREKYDADDSGFFRCYQHYWLSPEFVRVVLDRYFSPAWQSQHLQKHGGTVWVEAIAIPSGTVRISRYAAAAARVCADDKSALASKEAAVAREKAASADEWPSAVQVVNDMRRSEDDEVGTIGAASALYFLADIANKVGALSRSSEYDEKRSELFQCLPSNGRAKGRHAPRRCRSWSGVATGAFWANVTSPDFTRAVIDRYFSPDWQSRHLKRKVDVARKLDAHVGGLVFCVARAFGQELCKQKLGPRACGVALPLVEQFARGKSIDWNLVQKIGTDVAIAEVLKDKPALEWIYQSAELMTCIVEALKH